MHYLSSFVKVCPKKDRWLMGNDIGLGSVCFLRSETDLKRQSVTEPDPMTLPLNHLPYPKEVNDSLIVTNQISFMNTNLVFQ